MKYVIAMVETHNIDTNEELLPPYYKVYSTDDDGYIEFEAECETLDDAYDFIDEKERE